MPPNGSTSAPALPSFSEYLTRGRIPMATGRLMTMQMQLEQYFQDNRTYAGAPACNSADTGNSYFSFSCPVQEAQGFLLQAAGKGPMADFVFTMDDKGTMRTASVARGWRLPQGNCWVLRRDGSC